MRKEGNVRGELNSVMADGEKKEESAACWVSAFDSKGTSESEAEPIDLSKSPNRTNKEQ